MVTGILIIIVIGAVVGAVAGIIMGRSMSLLGCIACGIVGSALGGFIAQKLGMSGGFVMALVFDLIGACIVIFIVNLIFGRRR